MVRMCVQATTLWGRIEHKHLWSTSMSRFIFLNICTIMIWFINHLNVLPTNIHLQIIIGWIRLEQLLTSQCPAIVSHNAKTLEWQLVFYEIRKLTSTILSDQWYLSELCRREKNNDMRILVVCCSTPRGLSMSVETSTLIASSRKPPIILQNQAQPAWDAHPSKAVI